MSFQSAVLRGLYQLLTEPNPDDPLIPAIAEQYRSDNAGFKKEAMEQTKKVGMMAFTRRLYLMLMHGL